ncbi:MAG TPA: sigma-70 family RNA polymerase sigma factor [Mucilaginibacter sp.]|jgi:RNA polymerase sigma-70 factor (ECF subfamily)|nr:sigma-70 family RNA polymerase sigma factor [Mucilaginibacter sp.]
MHPIRSVAEEDIIDHCKTGSLKHQEMLYKLFYGYAMGIGLRYALQRDDALEIVNDAFIKVFNAINKYNRTIPFKAWLRTIIINTAIDRRRKELKFQLHTAIEEAGLLSYNPQVIENLSAADILSLLKQLPAAHNTVFNLYEIDGYSHDEIAGILNISASSSRVYLTRAKEKLRELLTISNNG